MPRWTTPTGLGGWLTLLLGILLAVILVGAAIKLKLMGGSQ